MMTELITKDESKKRKNGKLLVKEEKLDSFNQSYMEESQRLFTENIEDIYIKEEKVDLCNESFSVESPTLSPENIRQPFIKEEKIDFCDESFPEESRRHSPDNVEEPFIKEKVDSADKVRSPTEIFMSKRKRPDDDEIYKFINQSSDCEDGNGLLNVLSENESEDESTAAPSTSIDQNKLKWNKVIHNDGQIYREYKNIRDFKGRPGVSGFDNLGPFDSFQKFFPLDDICELVAQETNRFAQQKLAALGELPNHSLFRKWKEVSANDIKAFIALEIGMGMVHKPTLKSYFEKTFWLNRTPGYCSIFSRSQYELIRSFLHFSNNDEADANKDDRLFKIRKVLDLVKNTYTSCYSPNKEICVDETMVKFKGRLFFKHYLPSKPSSKWGVKLWSLCDSRTAFILKFSVYTGKEINQNLKEGLGSRVVKSLLEGFENKGHVCYMDNFYSNVKLFDDLLKMQIGACGTIGKNCENLPKEISVHKMKRGDVPIIWENESKTIFASTMQDTGRVNLISTVGNAGLSEVQVRSKKGLRTVTKPNIQQSYNKFMGGIDKFDQLCSTYPFKRKHMKWYQILWHFMIEVALVNGLICYNLHNPTKKLDQKIFRQGVIDGLVEDYSRRSRVARRFLSDPTRNRLTQRHFPSKFEGTKQLNCITCTILPSQCKAKGKGFCSRKRTSYYCNDCVDKPALCIVPCFRLYHTKKDFKEQCKCK